ncbi:hypothetical protein GP486_000115 [Trichoglossum hirsutum]|uniref:Uncharacterized protein n=1 Tax=Trichoglossum hirsutum TaxID=265104 RepID=A0A9P8LJ58_9PEZI|nr:hypothetical protein GP486_000115 [Trichoglossum hirsutum]
MENETLRYPILSLDSYQVTKVNAVLLQSRGALSPLELMCIRPSAEHCLLRALELFDKIFQSKNSIVPQRDYNILTNKLRCRVRFRKDAKTADSIFTFSDSNVRSKVKLQTRGLSATGAGVNANATDYMGRTTLQTASGSGHLETVERLLVAGANANARAGHFGRTALQSASEGGHLEAASEGGYLEIAERLLVVGADVNAVDYKGRTALQAASGGGHLETVEKFLVAGADVNATGASHFSRTALQLASGGGHLAVVEKLLTAGDDVNAAAAGDGWTALQAALRVGRLEIVERLLAAGADINTVGASNNGQTALKVASRAGHPKAIECLVAAIVSVFPLLLAILAGQRCGWLRMGRSGLIEWTSCVRKAGSDSLNEPNPDEYHRSSSDHDNLSVSNSDEERSSDEEDAKEKPESPTLSPPRAPMIGGPTILCGRGIHADIPTPYARKYEQTHAPSDSAAQGGPILLAYVQESGNQQSTPQTGWSLPSKVHFRWLQRSRSNFDPKVANKNPSTNSVLLPKLQPRVFAKFHKLIFARIHETEDLVIRTKEAIPDVADVDYEYEFKPADREVFMKIWEATLYHHLNYGCKSDSSRILLHIPKRKTSNLESQHGITGYGLHAQHGWCWWKFCPLISLTFPAGFVFAAWYLCHHPWGLQIAFISIQVLGIALSLGLILPDIKIPG